VFAFLGKHGSFSNHVVAKKSCRVDTCWRGGWNCCGREAWNEKSGIVRKLVRLLHETKLIARILYNPYQAEFRIELTDEIPLLHLQNGANGTLELLVQSSWVKQTVLVSHQHDAARMMRNHRDSGTKHQSIEVLAISHFEEVGGTGNRDGVTGFEFKKIVREIEGRFEVRSVLTADDGSAPPDTITKSCHSNRFVHANLPPRVVGLTDMLR